MRTNYELRRTNKLLQRENEQLHRELSAYQNAANIQAIQRKQFVADPILAAQKFAGIQKWKLRNEMEVRT